MIRSDEVLPGGGATAGATDSAGAFSAAALARLGRRGADIVVVTVPAPAIGVDRFPMPASAGCGFVWAPPAGPRFAAAGVAARLDARGPRRFADLAAAARALWPRVAEARHPACRGSAVGPRLFGGFAFVPGAADAPPWTAFGDASFVLPRLAYGVDGEQAWLQIATDRPTDPAGRNRLIDALEDALDACRRATAEDAAGAPAEELRAEEDDTSGWHEQVESIRRAIQAGACEKIVTARRSVLAARGPIDVTALVRRLGERHPDCFRFAAHRAGAAFVGATPERLVARRRDRVETEALAGSIAAGQRAGARLLESRKDRGEQELVVRAIARELGPRCARLDIPAEPRVRALRHVLHLETPIRGRLARPTHVLELVEALHPTPAVGGAPTGRALAWIADHERHPRGWYAAPVGWFDAAGDGEFAVAIRSGLLCGHRAYLFAGAGIVADSDPDVELAETRLKQRALLEALEAGGGGGSVREAAAG